MLVCTMHVVIIVIEKGDFVQLDVTTRPKALRVKPVKKLPSVPGPPKCFDGELEF